MAKLVSEIITTVTDSLGDRTGGKIGSSTVSDAIVREINTFLYKLAKSKKHIPAFEKTVQILPAAGTYQYAIPTTTNQKPGVPVNIKKFLQWIVYKSGETTGYPVSRLIASRRDQLFPLTNTNNTGRPYYYSVFGSLIEVYPMPDTDYVMIGRAIVWPNVVTSASTSLGLGEGFDDVAEDYATAACFMRLQQSEDAAYWFDQYKKNLAQTLSSLDDYPDEEWFPIGSTDLIGNMASLQPTSLHTNDYNPALGFGS